jgi:hypothetical protein
VDSETCVAAYPDGHTESTFDEDAEIAFLKEKVDAGADFIVTQLFYDVERFLQWVKKVREKGHYMSTCARSNSLSFLDRDHGPHNPRNHAHSNLLVISSSDEAMWHARSRTCYGRLGPH